MVVMIYAYESVYCGLHGINTGGVFEVDSVAEADDIGKGMAYDVIDGYSHAFEDYDLAYYRSFCRNNFCFWFS